MSEIRVEYRGPCVTGRRRKPEAVIRVGSGGAAEGEIRGPILWLTVTEAERIAAELVRAVKEAKRQTNPGDRPCTS